MVENRKGRRDKDLHMKRSTFTPNTAQTEGQLAPFRQVISLLAFPPDGSLGTTCSFCAAAVVVVYSAHLDRRGNHFPVRTVDAMGDPHLCDPAVIRTGEHRP